MTVQEIQRERANCILFGFMDFLCVVAMISVVFRKQTNCSKHLKEWYIANGVWAIVSMVFLWYFSHFQLKKGYQTKGAVIMTYVLELGYIVLSVIAWCMLTSPDPSGECQTEAASLIELMVDMIILLYMRSLRLMSIIVFLCLCGLPIIYCYFKHRPRPTEDPKKLNQSLNVVTLGLLHQLRNMNYRHKATTSAAKGSSDKSKIAAEESLLAPEPDLNQTDRS